MAAARQSSWAAYVVVVSW